MIKRLLRLAPILLLAACGADDPTGDNHFVALTGITITPQYEKMAVGTSNQFTAMGDFSGEFTRDITNEVAWSFDGTVLGQIPGGRPGLAGAISVGTATVTAAADGIIGTLDNFTVPPTTTEAVEVTPATAEVALGLNQQFTATATFNDGSGTFQQKITGAPGIGWSSSDETTATIDDKGLAKAIKVSATGTSVTITGTFDSASDTASLTVVNAAVESITITPLTPTLAVGGTLQFKADARMTDGKTLPLDGTNGNKAAWKSSNEEIATISPDGGLATAKSTGTNATGTADITATFSGKSATTTLSVSKVTEITFEPISPEVAVGETVQLTATATFANGKTGDITEVATWTKNQTGTGNADVVKGLVTGVAAGVVEITATKDVSQSVDVTVTQ